MNIMQLTQTIHLLPPMSAKPAKAAKMAAQPVLPGLEPEPPARPEVTNRQIAEYC
jgi:hypothetical protein